MSEPTELAKAWERIPGFRRATPATREDREKEAIQAALFHRCRSVNERGFFVGKPENYEQWAEGVLDGLRAHGVLPKVPRP